MMRARRAAATAGLAAAAFIAAFGAAQAQQLYRWTDDKGRVHITDTPPPANARDVQKGRASAASGIAAQESYELAQAQKEFPIVLYTAPACGEPCDQARRLLNQRGVPFREVLVADAAAREQLKRAASGAEEVPVLMVGRSVHKGYQLEAYEALLDAARYPKTGVLPPRAQAAPSAQSPAPAAEEPSPTGPYTPRFSK